jgi:hypothetical protein
MAADIVGTLGVAIIIVTYLLLQLGRISAEALSYSLLNILGSALIAFSLFTHWNLASFLIEFFWILISCIGVCRYFRKRRDANREETVR